MASSTFLDEEDAISSWSYHSCFMVKPMETLVLISFQPKVFGMQVRDIELLFMIFKKAMRYKWVHKTKASRIFRKIKCFLAGQTGTMHLKFPQSVSSWHVKVTFTAPVSDFQVWVGGNIQCSGLSCEFDNMDWDGNIEAGQILDVPYLMYFSSASEINGIILLGVQLCGNNGDECVIILHCIAYKKLQSYIKLKYYKVHFMSRVIFKLSSVSTRSKFF